MKNSLTSLPCNHNFTMKKTILLFLLVSVTFISCKNYQDITISKIENVSIKSITKNGIEAVITAKVKNPNHFGFTIYKSNVDASFAGMKVGKAQLVKKVKIKSNSETSHTFNINSDFSNLSLNDIPKIISIGMSKNMSVGLNGNLKVGKLFIKKSIPVDIKKDVPLNRAN